MENEEYIPRLILDDFRNVELGDKADLIFVDPPFGIDFKGNLGSYARHPDSLSYSEPEDYESFIGDLIYWCYKSSKDNSNLWVVSGWNNLEIILSYLRITGYHLLNHCIWYRTFGVYTKKKLVTSHYHLLLATKKKRDYTFNPYTKYMEDVWLDIKREYHPKTRTAGNELPEDLVKRCIQISSNENDLVVDPCVGSGTSLVSCLKTNRRFIGIEINPDLKQRILEKCLPNLKEGQSLNIDGTTFNYGDNF